MLTKNYRIVKEQFQPTGKFPLYFLIVFAIKPNFEYKKTRVICIYKLNRVDEKITVERSMRKKKVWPLE